MKKTKNNDPYKPSYLHAPIYSLGALAKALELNETVLVRIAARADDLYRKAAAEIKADGSVRQTFDAYPVLKAIQKRIKINLLKQVNFPSYLTGGLIGGSPRANAEIHKNAKIAFAEDIANFYPSVTADLIKKVWCGLFGFSDEVGLLLTKLTVKNNQLPQGAVTSTHLANLIFWSYEPKLVRQFNQNGYEYSRFIDDIVISSRRRLSKEEQAKIISSTYGMLLKHGLKPKRKKHELYTSGKRMIATKLMNNKRVALPTPKRQEIRKNVFQLELQAAFSDHDSALVKEIATVASKVGRLGMFHKNESQRLKTRVKAVREKVINGIRYATNPTKPFENASTRDVDEVPWITD